MASLGNPERWEEARQRFSCPFCGRERGRKCIRVRDDTYDEPVEMTGVHDPRLALLEEAEAGLPGRGF